MFPNESGKFILSFSGGSKGLLITTDDEDPRHEQRGLVEVQRRRVSMDIDSRDESIDVDLDMVVVGVFQVVILEGIKLRL